MRNSDTKPIETSRNLPVLVDVARPRPSLARVRTGASFVSQLIAAKDQLATQRQRRRAPTSVANGAYAQGKTITIQRMPVGYNRSLSA